MALIPFAQKGNRLVDITEVDRGLKCGCVCPSCHQRLVARQGDIATPHFAHDRNSSKQGINRDECKLSFYVAVRLMVKQCLNEYQSFHFVVPKLEASYSGRDRAGLLHHQFRTVAEKKTIHLTDLEVETNEQGCQLDVVGHIENAKLGIHFIYPGREKCTGIFEGRIGVVQVDLTKLERMYEQFDFSEGRPFYKNVMEFVSQNVSVKEWHHHPSLNKVKEVLRTNLSTNIRQANATLLQAEKQQKREERINNQLVHERKTQREKLSLTGDWFCPVCKISWYNQGKQKSCPRCYLIGVPLTPKRA